MPLIEGKSQKSFEKNIKTEMKHGKPQSQALAIAYAMKRKAQQKKAMGGEIEPVMEKQKDENHEDVMRYGAPKFEKKSDMQKLYEGGELVHIDIASHNVGEMEEEGEDMEEMAKGGDIVSRIMKKRYSRGGVVANEGQSMPSHQAGSQPREFDVLVKEDKLHSTQRDFGDSLGNAREDHDRADIVEKIMRKRAKQHNPKVMPE